MSLFTGRRRSVLDRRIVWWIALVCAIFGLLSLLGLIIVPLLTGYACWIVLGALILLLAATKWY